MSISHLSLVNQKLAFAGATIGLLNNSLGEPKGMRKLESQALADAVVFHLIVALHFYLRELAEHHQIKKPSVIRSIQDLISSLQQVDKVSSESSELLALSQLSDSWLSQLTQYHDHIFKSPEKPREKKAFGQENLIALVELTEAQGQELPDLTVELLTSWLESFGTLVTRQRETIAEY
tara:strand:+ start:267 stop:800 length:534 start_codon:yes stop_codon:yes gene_type:complete